LGSPQLQSQIQRWLRDMGASVVDEHDATGGAHWHIDY
jgi:hypothetical protein